MSSAVRGLGVLDAFALGTGALWCAWVVVATVWGGRPLGDTSVYIAPVLFALLGIAAGRRLGGSSLQPDAPARRSGGPARSCWESAWSTCWPP